MKFSVGNRVRVVGADNASFTITEVEVVREGFQYAPDRCVYRLDGYVCLYAEDALTRVPERRSAGEPVWGNRLMDLTYALTRLRQQGVPSGASVRIGNDPASLISTVVAEWEA